jgi:hypothetical protein
MDLNDSMNYYDASKENAKVAQFNVGNVEDTLQSEHAMLAGEVNNLVIE